ncbi:MAG: cysteine--tRNA ligase [Chloroflexaceae bacterium]|nr:cysteine--tRNA ligase [Chloroflexaceae bacterium]
MYLYNSFTATREPFVIPTAAERPVTLYVCGVTPYDTTHVGHARTYLVFDVLIRYLRWRGAEVRYCQNVTDVDDPLFERAERDGISWQELSRRELERFVSDCAALNMIAPTYLPKASEEIAAVIEMNEHLVRLGHAYVCEGNVYFDIHTDPNFGAMARMGYEAMLATANQRGNTPNDPRKRDPLDFVLWQTGKPGEPTWESPWGMGRPGWHIECSAMATRYLGPQIDIHGGGSDLLFPHHSCEIAQSEAVTGKRPFSRFWVHVGMVYLDGEKMSKSLGNLVLAHKALQEHQANALRWYLLHVPYRDIFPYERGEVGGAGGQAGHLHDALRATGGAATALDVSRAREAFGAALADDLNTPLALDVLTRTAHEVLRAAAEGRDIEAAQATLAELAGVLGFQHPTGDE